jgi:hypothetical protein
MHKGKTYPYAPAYWATELQFWPGFVPWKMLGFLDEPTDYPWSLLAPHWRQVSNPMVAVPDFTQALWHFPIVDVPYIDEVVVSIEMLSDAHGKYGVWRAVAYYLEILLGSAWLYVDFPQYVCDGSSKRWWKTADRSIPPDGSFLNFTPATYAQGGSPWS